MYSLIICELSENNSITQLIKDTAKAVSDKIDEVIVIRQDDGFIYNRSIINAVKNSKNRDCIIVPSSIVPSCNFL